MYYIFILNSGFRNFNNYPPRLALAEIKPDLPCPENVYEAVNSTDCFQKVYNRNSVEPSSLERILKLLLAEDFGEEQKSILSTLTPLHYFIIINGSSQPQGGQSFGGMYLICIYSISHHHPHSTRNFLQQKHQ
jgi:hypothetical protein